MPAARGRGLLILRRRAFALATQDCRDPRGRNPLTNNPHFPNANPFEAEQNNSRQFSGAFRPPQSPLHCCRSSILLRPTRTISRLPRGVRRAAPHRTFREADGDRVEDLIERFVPDVFGSASSSQGQGQPFAQNRCVARKRAARTTPFVNVSLIMPDRHLFLTGKDQQSEPSSIWLNESQIYLRSFRFCSSRVRYYTPPAL